MLNLKITTKFESTNSNNNTINTNNTNHSRTCGSGKKYKNCHGKNA
ncbi:MAG: SEC-C domain-containing protein [Clostridia bacterium]|nr:SEC-C domain-containing protein [Clostridia bacterium]